MACTRLAEKEKKSTLTSPIKYVNCMLYFEKPVSGQQYFDVLEAVYSPIESTTASTYLYPDSSNYEKTTYSYSNNLLE